MERQKIESALYEITQLIKHLEIITDKALSIKSDLEDLEGQLPAKEQEDGF